MTANQAMPQDRPAEGRASYVLDRLLMRIYRARGAASARPPLNLPNYLSPVLLALAVVLAAAVFHTANSLIYAGLQSRLEEGITVRPPARESAGAQMLPDDLLGVFALTRRIAPELDVSAEFAANVMPYLEKDALTEDERAYLRNYQEAKFTNDPLWIETDLLFRVMRRRAEGAAGEPAFAFGKTELQGFLEGLSDLAGEKDVMGFLRVFAFRDVPDAPRCGGETEDPLACRLSILLAGFQREPNLLGLLALAPPGKLEDRLYAIDALSPAYRENESRIEDTRTLIEALFDETAQTAGAYRRSLEAINGPIQWTTLTLSIWCALLLLLRRAWARLQTRISDGERLELIEPELAGAPCPWGTESAGESERVRAATGRFGSQMLPFRLLRSLAAEDSREGGQANVSLIDRVIEGYRDQVADQEYTLVGWLITLVPTLGFIGTIYGMMQAMGGAHLIVAATGQAELEASVLQLSQHLGTAFDTTLIALVMAALLEGLRGNTQRREAQAFDTLARRARADIGHIRRRLAEAA